MKQPSRFLSSARELKTNRSLVRAYFELRYLKERATYHSKNSRYEQHRDFAFSLLDDRRYVNGLEVGCGEGFTTERIAARCDKLLSTDVSAVAVKRARKRNANLAGVEYRQHDLVGTPLSDTFDYIFCGEVLYYLRYDQLLPVVDSLASQLRGGGVLHLLHCRSINDDDVGLDKDFGAKTIHDLFASRDDLRVDADEYYDKVRATVLVKTAPDGSETLPGRSE